MGDVKGQMQTTKDEKSGIFGKLKRKSVKPASETAKTFADHISAADEQLASMITTKKAELESEKGREDYNRRALAHLRAMEFHLNALIDTAADYSELK